MYGGSRVSSKAIDSENNVNTRRNLKLEKEKKKKMLKILTSNLSADENSQSGVFNNNLLGFFTIITL